VCGIFGFIGEQDVTPILINGLKKLEYRGYDSAGICIKHKDTLTVVKKKGRVKNLLSPEDMANIQGRIGIAHTRWATHGEPNSVNAHPHQDCTGRIAIVHNGIIENYDIIKELLIGEGHIIKSDTDTEIIAHLIEKFYSGSLEEAVMEALKCVEGTYGLAVISKEEDKIVVARRGSPIILGLGKNFKIVSSDAVAILEHTKDVIYLHDEEIAALTPQKIEIYDVNGQAIDKDVEKIRWNIEQIEKKGFKHFMLKEIFEQPDSIKNVLRGRLKENGVKFSFDLNPSDVERIVIIGCGTSWHAALIGKYLIEKHVSVPVEVDYASEFRYRDIVLREKDLVIFISQSGETADTLAALRKVKQYDRVKTFGIVNVVGSTIAREVDMGIYLHAGPEIGVASTKAFTCQIMALFLLALHLEARKGKGISRDIIDEINFLPAKIESVLKQHEYIKNIADKFKGSSNFLYLGRGINFPVALEGALKLKEVSYIHAEGYPAAEMKHGPIALIDENMPVVFIATQGRLFEKVINNMEEVKARRGIIITITDTESRTLKQLSHCIIRVPKTIEQLLPIINIIPLQLLAYYIADARGLNVDKPRNLAKSVTVE